MAYKQEYSIELGEMFDDNESPAGSDNPETTTDQEFFYNIGNEDNVWVASPTIDTGRDVVVNDATISSMTTSNHLNKTEVLLILTIIFLLLTILMAIFSGCRRCYRRTRTKNKNSDLFRYFARFDSDDLDLKKSATYGWHGIYRNQLAEGRMNDRVIIFTEDCDLATKRGISASHRVSSPSPSSSLFEDYNTDSLSDSDSDEDDHFSQVRIDII
eukprot:CAMPEP_0201120262 /NCGR_PEP_ID=MMETSP0850-20130426/4343_1 /ASSEMBLY_ACC=CAM_ASM_000622 /TAXON_ID=183588 /ORGANISM="Pseudo-nitzschia fraudulenta, Strain WWA7" /LENGTH=213 /DNA_ID=CAMNT_0047386337 /DNA_START=106 /DNA_END=747 /DNA_ORIENTATION=-